MLKKILALNFFLLSSACTSFLGSSSTQFDARKIKIQVFSFFNQRAPLLNTSTVWKGDWIFRRDRLILIEKELANDKPDLNIFQNVLSRGHNSYESDLGILGYGVFKGYKFHLFKMQDYKDTNEFEYHAICISKPLEFQKHVLEEPIIQAHHYLSWDLVKLEKQPILVVNIQLNAWANESDLQIFIQKIKLIMEKEDICSSRLIMAITAPSDAQKAMLSLPDFFNLQDASKGFCNIESSCYTADPKNEIYLRTQGEILPSRYDFLFVPENSKVTYHKINFQEARSLKEGEYSDYNLHSLSPSDRYGLRVDLFLSQCKK